MQKVREVIDLTNTDTQRPEIKNQLASARPELSVSYIMPSHIRTAVCKHPRPNKFLTPVLPPLMNTSQIQYM